jgi:hypothetical protein
MVEAFGRARDLRVWFDPTRSTDERRAIMV